MTSRISHTSFDAINAYAQSVFWSQVLDFAEDPDDPNEPGHEECLIISPDQSQLLLFITVPDGKQVKNRVHLDLRPVDRTREQEVERVLARGQWHLPVICQAGAIPSAAGQHGPARCTCGAGELPKGTAVA